jgi:dienelactone hydrolase
VWNISGEGVRFRALVVAGDGPAAVILPHLQGTARIPEYVARRFASEGYQVVAQLPPEVALEPGSARESMLEVMRERIREGRAAARIAARELGAPCRVLVGVSVGGMVAIPVAALEEDIDGVVSMLAGGGMGWIVDHSKEPLIQPSPAAVGEAPPALAEAAALVDPLTWAPRLRKGRVLMIRGVWDQVIPPPATHALWDALGRPEIHAYPSGHYSFGIFLPRAVDRALEKADALCRQIAQPRADGDVED